MTWKLISICYLTSPGFLMSPSQLTNKKGLVACDPLLVTTCLEASEPGSVTQPRALKGGSVSALMWEKYQAIVWFPKKNPFFNKPSAKSYSRRMGNRMELRRLSQKGL